MLKQAPRCQRDRTLLALPRLSKVTATAAAAAIAVVRIYRKTQWGNVNLVASGIMVSHFCLGSMTWGTQTPK